jgi:hypothetical protein
MAIYFVTLNTSRADLFRSAAFILKPTSQLKSARLYQRKLTTIKTQPQALKLRLIRLESPINNHELKFLRFLTLVLRFSLVLPLLARALTPEPTLIKIFIRGSVSENHSLSRSKNLS